MNRLLKSLYRKAWFEGPDQGLYLTYDDGPDPEGSLAFAQELAQRGIKATFFCLGTALEKVPEYPEALLALNHSVGYHGYAHLSGFSTPQRAYLRNFERPKGFPSRLLRVPYGRILPGAYRRLSRDWQMVFWSHMPGDYRPALDAEALWPHLEASLQPGAVVALHDRGEALQKQWKLLDALEKAIAQRGLEAKSLPMAERK